MSDLPVLLRHPANRHEKGPERRCRHGPSVAGSRCGGGQQAPEVI